MWFNDDDTTPMASATAKTTMMTATPFQHGGDNDDDAMTPMANATAKVTMTMLMTGRHGQQ